MAKMVYDFFRDEEGFESVGLTQRFDSVQAGINDLETSGCAKGCLNDQHIPGFMTTANTLELPLANKGQTDAVDCGYGVTSDEGAGPGLFVGGASYYYNLLNTSGAGPVGSEIVDCRQKPPPDDGVWEPIRNNVPQDLEVSFPATDFTEFVNPVLIVMMNAHVERLAFNYFPPVGGNWPSAVPGDGQVSWFLNQGVAFAIQMHDAINNTWHHIYDPLGSTPVTGNPLRRTERRVGAMTVDFDDPPVDQDSTTILPIYRDVSIRCAITANDLFNAYDSNGQQYTIEKIDKVRGVLSLIAMTGYAAVTIVEVNTYCAISNANLSVFMPRCKERN